MRHLTLTLLASALLCSASWAQTTAASAPAKAASAPKKQEKTEIVEINAKDPLIKTAMKKAQASVDEVLKVAESGDSKYDNIGVRVLVREGKRQEFVWLMPFEKKGKGYTGFVNSAPSVLQRLQYSMHYDFKREDIVDWMYEDKSNNSMHGHFITCAQVMKSSPKDASEFKRRYGLDCAR